MPDELVEVLRAAPLRLGEGATGQAALRREPVQVPDISDERAYSATRLRTVLLAARLPLGPGGAAHVGAADPGVLTVWRQAAGLFPDEVVNLLQTFATQSALAIQNARLFQELEAKSRELEVASRHKSQFLANMSHELRTPLNAIIGYSEMLQEEAEDQQAESFIPDLQKIHAAGKHLLGLINDILDLSKIEAGKMELYLETFDVAPLVRDVAAIVEPLVEKNANHARGRVRRRRRRDARRPDQGPPGAVQPAVATPASSPSAGRSRLDGDPAGVRRRLTPSSSRSSDTGIGMTPEQMARLFQAFTPGRRLDHAAGTAAPGSAWRSRGASAR